MEYAKLKKELKRECEEGMFNNVRVRAFVKCAKEDGVDNLLEHLVRNKENGIAYHKIICEYISRAAHQKGF